jgi:hypothetical protein
MFLVGREATHAQTRQHHRRLEIVSHPMPLSVVQRDKNHMVINPDYKVDVEELPMHFFEDICSIGQNNLINNYYYLERVLTYLVLKKIRYTLR